MRRLTLLIILVATAAVALPQEMKMPAPKTSGPQSDAQKAFEIMKTMAGSWEGNIVGMSTHITIRVTSSGNAILHEATGPGRPDNPITMIDANHHAEAATWMLPGNKPMVGQFVLTRTK